MRALRAPVVTAALLIVSGPVACGLDAGGRLTVGDAGGPEMMMTVTGDDAAAVATSDGDVPDQPADDATTPGDDGSPVRGDASATTHPDANPPPKDAAADVAPFTCAGCLAQRCPTQRAACGMGSQCLAYRDCDVACGVSSGSNCGSTCGSMYPTGQSAFAALTLCDLGCGAGCAAGLSVGTP